jgi:hypothetical protein
MPKDKADRIEARQKARKAATEAGKDWAKLSKEERKPFLAQSGARDESRAKARALAEQAGQTWSKLDRKQRQQYIREARG